MNTAMNTAVNSGGLSFAQRQQPTGNAYTRDSQEALQSTKRNESLSELDLSLPWLPFNSTRELIPQTRILGSEFKLKPTAVPPPPRTRAARLEASAEAEAEARRDAGALRAALADERARTAALQAAIAADAAEIAEIRAGAKDAREARARLEADLARAEAQ
eukprot:257488-Chlamydomonas_euryale.AAC.1